MRTTTAYFAGIGTAFFAVAAGLGGGYLAANVVSPQQPKYGTETTLLERRMASQPVPVTIAPSEPVPHVAATTLAATNPLVAPAQPQSVRLQAEAAAAPAPAIAEAKTASTSATPQFAAPPPLKPAVQASEKPAAPQDAFARARDADVQRAAVEKRRAERRQRGDDKRRLRQPREQELDAVEAKVREATEPRQAFAVEPVRIETTRVRLFDLD